LTKEKKEIGRFFKHSYIYAIGNIINRIGAFLLLPVYTNYLTVEEYGALELFYGVSAVIFGFLSIGIAHATLRFYFEYDDEKNRLAVVSTNFIASFVLSLIGVSIVAIWYKELSVIVFSSEIYAKGILIILGTIVFELSSQICLAYVRAIERSMLFVYISLAKLVLQVSINIYLVIFSGEGVVGILFGNFMAVLLGWLVLTIFTLKRCRLSFHFDKLIVILKYSFPFLLGTFTSLISTNVDKFSLNYIDALGAVGIYMLAMKFSMLIEQLIGEPFARSYGSFRFSIMKNDNASEIQANIVKYLLYGSLFIALGMSLFIKDLLMLISKPEFWSAANLVPIIMIAAVLKIMNYPVQTGILYAKQTKYFFYIGVVTAIISSVGNLSLIPVIGVYGACITLIVTNLVSLVLMHKKSQNYFNVSYDFPKIILSFLLATIIYLISRLIPSEIWYLTLFAKSLLIVAYVTILWKSSYFLNKEEQDYVNVFVQQKILRKK
jgi:O-antigen/teichoic acid export membrane protein